MLPSDHYRGETWLVRPMGAEERVCSSYNEVEFDEHAKITMYKVVMNVIGSGDSFFGI